MKMKIKILTLALALTMIMGAAAAEKTVEEKATDGSRNLTYNVTAPDSPAALGEDANQFVAFSGLGVLAIIWIVFYSMPNQIGYSALESMISANFVTTGVSLLIFPMGWIQGEVVAFLIVALAGSLGYSRMSSGY